MINLYRDPNGEKVIVYSTSAATSQNAIIGDSEINTLQVRIKELESQLAGNTETSMDDFTDAH